MFGTDYLRNTLHQQLAAAKPIMNNLPAGRGPDEEKVTDSHP